MSQELRCRAQRSVHRGILSLSKGQRGRSESGRNGSERTRVETLKINEQRPRTTRDSIAPRR